MSVLGDSINALELAIKQAIANEDLTNTIIELWDSMMSTHGHSDEEILIGFKTVLKTINSKDAENILKYYIKEIENSFLDHLD